MHTWLYLAGKQDICVFKSNKLYHDYRLLVEYDIKIEFTELKERKMIESVVLTVTDMKCGGCETNITGKLEAINGVVSVKASFKDKEVSVEYDTEKTSLDTIKNTITGAGFTVK